MKLSQLTEVRSSRDMIDVFRGYNHNLRVQESEFYDMKNLSSSLYPVLSTRQSRGDFTYPFTGTHSVTGMIAKDSLCHVDGTKFYIDNHEVVGITLQAGEKQLVSMGSYVLIFPDKKYINTIDTSDKGDIEASFQTVADTTFQMCQMDGSSYENAVASESEPPDPTNGMLWIDTSVTPHVLKQFSETTSVWAIVPTTYVKIQSANIGQMFSQYDAVNISGIEAGQLADLNGQTSVIWGKGDDYIIVVGILDSAFTQSSAITLTRKMPDMDFIIESENRLWGCKYGVVDGKVLNEIYASKLGDFKNWNCFMGLSSDSYTASCGTDGQFTGAITHLGHPLFFKENYLHKVYGNFPSNFQIQTTPCRGVMKGAGKSLAIVNETLYYKSRNGVCAYDGSLPAEVSYELGDIRYTGTDNIADKLRNGATAGSHGNKYYISMKSEADNNWYLFVYDASVRQWHKEDSIKVGCFCSCRDQMYFTVGNQIKLMFGAGETFDWYAETGNLGLNLPDKKYISRMNIRMALDPGTVVKARIQYDSDGLWHDCWRMVGRSLRTFTVPIRPRRCDHFKIRFEGSGQGKIYSYTKVLEQGSDM